jgi:DNA-binding NarL/FixJ family response regulator
VNPNRSSISLPDPRERSTLPRRRPRPASSTDKGSSPQKRAAGPARILVVEDDFLVAMQVETALAEAGFALAGIAVSAEEAVELAASQRPAVVVMDIRLAGKRDGIDAALELFQDHGIRCIFATAHHDQDARRRAKPATPLGWLQKPYTMASLIRMIRQALRDSSG